MTVSRFLWHYLSKRKRWLLGALTCIGLAELSRQIGFYYASRIANVLSQQTDRLMAFYDAVFYALLFGLFIQGRTLIQNFHYVLDIIFVPDLKAKISKDLFNYAHKHSVQFFAEEMSGRIAGKINQTVQAVFDLKKHFFSPFLSFFRLFIGCCFLSSIHIVFGFALVVFVFLYTFFLWYSSQKMIKASVKVHDKESLVNGVLVDTLFNYNLVKNDGNMFYEKRRLFNDIKNWVYLDRNIYKIDFYMQSMQGIVCSVLRMSFLFIPLYYWMQNQISVADFVLAESLVTYLTMFAMNVSGPVSRFFRAWGGIKDGLDFIYRPLQVQDKKHAKPIQIKKGKIAFKKISFFYRNVKNKKANHLFKMFDLSIDPKTKIGLVGSSGSGKSSLVKLLMRYYDIQEGEILIDEQNISKVTQESLRKSISVIEQNPCLFNRSIKENIGYGNLSATDEEIVWAAKKAYIHDFIMRLPQGYDTIVGERGIILSGGERQRIAIARAILKDSKILILDEATSALDSESELYIQKALKSIMKDKTVIAIAHRLSTLREMDCILVMEKGKIVEKGTHKELLKKEGYYASFYHLQTKNFKRKQ